MPVALPGFSGGKLLGRSKAEKGREEEDEEKEGQERQMSIAGAPKEADTVGGGVT